MRWEIKTKLDVKETKDQNKITQNKTKTVTKTQYITVGDIVGVGKSTAGAVQKLAKSLPAFIENFKSDPKGMVMALGVNSLLQPLAAMVTGMDQYKKVMGIIDSLTPIMKMVARASGVWCSPGNAAAIGQILLGMATKLLIQVATSAVLKLKDMVWNFEFEIRSIDTKTSILITKKIKQFNKNNKVSLKKDIFNNLNGNNTIEYSFENKKKKINEIIDDILPEPNVKQGIKNVIPALSGKEPTEEEKCQQRNNYLTSLKTASEDYRIFSGSLDDNGIYYSDDNGITWTQSDCTSGSFSTFCELDTTIDGELKKVYIAGSTEKVISVEPTKDIIDDAYDEDKHYSKDYYRKDLIKFTKLRKDELLKESNYNINLFNDKKEFKPGVGIMYSLDYGLTWASSNLNSGRFERMYNYNNRVVASSYDYQGLYYSDDGINWSHSQFKDGTLIDKGRWITLRDTNNDVNKVSAVSAENINTFKIGRIITIEEVPTFNYSLNTELDSKSYQGSNFDNFDDYDGKIRKIFDYIHDHYSYNLTNYSNDFWFNKIQEIKAGTYTLDDAKAGKDL